MNKSKIDWCDYTWNPVTGCFHNCPYCYAKGIAHRFRPEFRPNSDEIDGYYIKTDYYDKDTGEAYDMLVLNIPAMKYGKLQPYPMCFNPTFHRYRLNEPEKKTKGANIFVCSMADLFGEWVPDKWIEEILDVSTDTTQHNYLFLTKNPKRYNQILNYYMGEERGCEEGYTLCDNLWFGATVTQQADIERVNILSKLEEGHRFLSIEPLQSQLVLNLQRGRCPNCGSSQIYQDNPATTQGLPFHYCDCCGEWEGNDDTELKPSIDWVIIGAETGNRKDKIIPKRKWIEDLVNECKAAGVPVFMKSNLSEVWGANLIQDYPEALKGR